MTLPAPGELPDDGERVQCHVCGVWLVRLAGHIGPRHGLQAWEYKERYGLDQGHPLASRSYVERQRAIMLEIGAGAWGRKVLAELEPVPRHAPVSLETRRKRAEIGRNKSVDPVWQRAGRDAAYEREERLCTDCGAIILRARIWHNREVVCPACRHQRMLAQQRQRHARQRANSEHDTSRRKS